ncbi:MAG: hypothetical protein ACUZ8E_11765 [Candidatus Anammoxibacter sp.]
MLTKLQFYMGLGIISILSLLPGSAMPRLGSQDKVCHAIGYLMLFLSVSIGYNFRKWNLVKFSGLFLYSILIEVQTSYTQGYIKRVKGIISLLLSVRNEISSGKTGICA